MVINQSHRCVGHKQVVFVPFPQWAWQAWDIWGNRIGPLHVGFVCLKMISMVCIMCKGASVKVVLFPPCPTTTLAPVPSPGCRAGSGWDCASHTAWRSFRATVFETCTINIISLTSGRWCWQNDECQGAHNPGDSHNLTLRCSSSLPKSFGIEPCWKYNFLIFWSPAGPLLIQSLSSNYGHNQQDP